MPYLSGENLVAGYGGADILHGCSIDVNLIVLKITDEPWVIGFWVDVFSP